MNAPNLCPCCSDPLLRHIRQGGSIYWFCSHCWQEMPNLVSEIAERKTEKSPAYSID